MMRTYKEVGCLACSGTGKTKIEVCPNCKKVVPYYYKKSSEKEVLWNKTIDINWVNTDIQTWWYACCGRKVEKDVK